VELPRLFRPKLELALRAETRPRIKIATEVIEHGAFPPMADPYAITGRA
jgi:hypothetical protein